jgi:hypothetical protein
VTAPRWRALGGLRHVGRRDWPAVLVSAAAGLAVEIGLRTLRLPTLARLVGAPLDDSGASPPPRGVAEPAFGPDSETQPQLLDVLTPEARRRLMICTRILRHWPYDEKCLRLSLVCGWRIRRLRPHLVVGVAVVDDQVKAHAWLTVAGVSLDPSASQTFATLEPVRPTATDGPRHQRRP